VKLCLLGAGGHAKVVADIAERRGHHIVACAAPYRADWIDALWIERDEDVMNLPDDVGLALGMGAVTPQQLQERGYLLARFAGARAAPHLVHPRATVSERAEIGPSAQIMPGSVVNAGASIGAFSIINSGAIVEHDATIGEGAHIAPGAIILGGAVVGDYAMVGAGAVVLPSASIASCTLVKASTLVRSSQS
jgi:sugar O-acyltransferase (sialic acid O-acetyltransferase NeuD family)